MDARIKFQSRELPRELMALWPARHGELKQRVPDFHEWPGPLLCGIDFSQEIFRADPAEHRVVMFFINHVHSALEFSKRKNIRPFCGIKSLPGQNFIPASKCDGNATSDSYGATCVEISEVARLVIKGLRMEAKRPIQKKAAEVLELDQSKFEAEVLNSTEPVLVGFLASWSKPCQLIGPVLEEVAQACYGKSKVFKVNVDDNLDLASRYAIQSVPTLNYFINGVVRLKIVGMASPKAILAKLEYFTQGGQPSGFERKQ
jgi:thioredoxin 1